METELKKNHIDNIKQKFFKPKEKSEKSKGMGTSKIKQFKPLVNWSKKFNDGSDNEEDIKIKDTQLNSSKKTDDKTIETTFKPNSKKVAKSKLLNDDNYTKNIKKYSDNEYSDRNIDIYSKQIITSKKSPKNSEEEITTTKMRKKSIEEEHKKSSISDLEDLNNIKSKQSKDNVTNQPTIIDNNTQTNDVKHKVIFLISITKEMAQALNEASILI